MKQSLLAILIFFLVSDSIAQYNPRPTRSRFYNSKNSTFKIKAGDILVYHVKNNDDEYNFIVTVKQFGSSINFAFDMPEKGTNATINIQPQAVNTATKYNNYFTSANQNFNNQSTVWLSKKNYREIVAAKRTTMDVGNGSTMFTRTRNTTHKINYKGKDKIITVHEVQSKDGENKNLLQVLTEVENPLIVSMDLGWTITLKEVR